MDSRLDLNRRSFVKSAAMVGASAIIPSSARAQQTTPPQSVPSGEVPKKPLGRTGVQVSAMGLGGYHLGSAETDQAAVEIVAKALDHGVNFFDNAWGISRWTERRATWESATRKAAASRRDDEGLHPWSRQESRHAHAGRVVTPPPDRSSRHLADT